MEDIFSQPSSTPTVSKAIAEDTKRLDEICFTPPRVYQVFWKNSFSSLFGPAHFLPSTTYIIASLIISGLFIAKVFNKNDVNTLHEVLDNCKKEFKMTYDLDNVQKRTELENYFKQDLKNKKRGYLDVKIAQNKKGKWDLKYTLSKKLVNILESDNLTYNTVIQNLEAYGLNAETDKDIIAFLGHIIPAASRDKTIGELRKEAIEKLKVSANDLKWGAIDFVGVDVPFHYWLFFFVYDINLNNDDAASWGVGNTVLTIGGAVVLSAIKLGAKIRQYFKNLRKAKQKEAAIADKDKEAADKKIKHKADDLKHQQLMTFFLDALNEHNIDFNTALDPAAGITPKKREEKTLWNSVISWVHKTFYKTKNSQEYIDSLKAEVDPDNAGLRRNAAAVAQSTAGPIIRAAFSEWVGTVAIGVFDRTTAVATWLSSAASNFLDVGFGLAFGFIGWIYYKIYTKPGLEEERKKLEAQVNAADDTTFNKINLVEALNAELNDAIKNLDGTGYKRPKVIHGYDDRANRRITTEKTKDYTSLKKTINRTAVFIGQAGTGILLVRLTILGFAKGLAAFMSATAFASFYAIAFPIITAIALTVGLVWGCVYLYKYTLDRRLEAAKKFLAEKDMRLDQAERTFHTYRDCLKKLDPDNQFFSQEQKESAPGTVSIYKNEHLVNIRRPAPPDTEVFKHMEKTPMENHGLFAEREVKQQPAMSINDSREMQPLLSPAQ